MPLPLHLDYETRSAVDLTEVGAYRYAADPSTRILMLGIALGDEEPRFLFPRDVLEMLGLEQDPIALEWALLMLDPEQLVYAHSAGFEIAISRYRLLEDLGVEPPQLHQWRCTAAMARRAGLPSALDKLGGVLQLTDQKDEAGKKLIKLFSEPQTRGKRKGQFVMPWDEPEKWWQFVAYCGQDVRTEREAGHRLSAFELTGDALRTWKADCLINDRGVPVNVEALKATQVIIDQAQSVIGDQFKAITELTYRQRDRVLDWFEARGYQEGDMKATSVARALANRAWATEEVYRALELKQDLSFSAVNKVLSMLECECGDGLVRGTLLWHGAGPGRWSGKLIQPQNFKRPTFKDTIDAYAAICDGAVRSAEDMELLFGTPLDVIASCIRHYIQLPNGQPIFDADYTAVEARIVCWLAGQLDALMRFRKYDETGSREFDSYIRMAMVIFSTELADISKDQRWLGKQTVLGCGYQMWVDKFLKQALDNAEKYNIKGIRITKELAEKAVISFREEYDKVVELWYACDRAARNAILHPGKIYRAGPFLKFGVVTTAGVQFLLMKLPSGRNIMYPWPQLVPDPKRPGKDMITYYGRLPMKSGKWGRVSTYGGKLVENAAQGTAGDFMGNGTVVALERDFDVFMLVHDQALAAHDGRSAEEFADALTTLPPWATGMPLRAECKVVPFYLKL